MMLQETPYISPGKNSQLSMRIHSDDRILAVSKDDQKHQIYDFSQLDKCKPVGTGHGRLLLCPNANIYFRAEHNSCIVGLFKRDMEVIKDYCRWKSVKKEPYALQKNSNQFIVFVPTSTELKIVCTDGTRTIENRIEIIGHNLVTVQGLCRGFIDRSVQETLIIED